MNQKRTILLGLTFLFALFTKAQDAPITKESFNNINLGYPGLEKVNNLFTIGKYEEASKELLTYYRKKGDNTPKVKTLDKASQLKADNALEHKFQPQKGYGYFDYGKDINWSLWPVKDNEVRWQLHRVTWWQPMGMAYRISGDEKYAKEWIFQFRDWAKKNPLGLSEENDRFAWRPLEVSERIQSFPGTFNLFVVSPNFTPSFLLEFLNSFNKQTDYISKNYSKEGNHLLFEAQRVLSAGSFFPELKLSSKWRKSGIDVLNSEIKKQVFQDGMQWELSPIYHVASIEIFLKAYNSAKMAKIEKEFPESYSRTIEKMMEATANISFPDYNNPMFGDSWIVEKNTRMKQFQEWSKIFPNNAFIKYFATNGKEGSLPKYLSHGLTDAGFYTFRNGWNKKSTVMILKASPPGEFHAQPDNGTFELWVKGRNFMPDAGCYVYSGDAEITKMRNWYRQSRVHSTLTLDNKNMLITKAVQKKWETGENLDVLTFSNPSYTDLDHQRSVLFINQKYFLIIDRVIGKASGTLGTHFQLKEDSNPVFDKEKKRVYSTYADGNNLLIQNFNTELVTLGEEEGKVSYQYQKELKRPGFVFEKTKTDTKTQAFVSLIYPFDGNKAPEISIITNRNNDYINGNIDLTLVIDGKQNKLKATM